MKQLGILVTLIAGLSNIGCKDIKNCREAIPLAAASSDLPQRVIKIAPFKTPCSLFNNPHTNANTPLENSECAMIQEEGGLWELNTFYRKENLEADANGKINTLEDLVTPGFETTVVLEQTYQNGMGANSTLICDGIAQPMSMIYVPPKFRILSSSKIAVTQASGAGSLLAGSFNPYSSSSYGGYKVLIAQCKDAYSCDPLYSKSFKGSSSVINFQEVISADLVNLIKLNNKEVRVYMFLLNAAGGYNLYNTWGTIYTSSALSPQQFPIVMANPTYNPMIIPDPYPN